MAEGTESPQEHRRTSSGVDISTLLVAALASLVAALVTSKLWASGTLISTAMTPVIVALLKEWLQRPVEKVGAVAKAPLVAVRAAPSRAVPALARPPAAPEVEQRGHVLEPTEPDTDEYEQLDTLVPPGEDGTGVTPYRVYRKRPRRRWWVVGLATGALAFGAAAFAITVPEVVGGGSVVGGGRTTLFSRHARKATGDKSKTSTEKKTSTDKKASGEQKSSTDKSSTTKSSPSDQPATSRSNLNSQDKSTTTTPSTQSSTPTETTPRSTSGTETQTTPTQTTPTTPQAAPPATP